MKADAVIDFSLADAITPLMRFAKEKKLPTVVCTTGLSPEQEQEINAAAEVTAIFHSSNMSLGISLLTTVLKRVSRLLYDSGFDIEILEKHHNRKIDAPSGTAIVLADSVNAALGNRLKPVYDRSPRRERRSRDELGMASVRGGTICGEHSVIFAGNEEVIELKHSAFSREIYAVGAINAAKYIYNRPPGLYTMENLINLEEL
jgi:4-hydroxy-tetrahydrodipicolinate reductase